MILDLVLFLLLPKLFVHIPITCGHDFCCILQFDFGNEFYFVIVALFFFFLFFVCFIADGCTDDDWFGKARDAIQERMSQYKGELRFTLLGIIKNLQATYNDEIKQLQGKKDGTAMEIDSKYDDLDANAIDAKIAQLRSKIEDEKAKFERYRVMYYISYYHIVKLKTTQKKNQNN